MIESGDGNGGTPWDGDDIRCMGIANSKAFRFSEAHHQLRGGRGLRSDNHHLYQRYHHHHDTINPFGRNEATSAPYGHVDSPSLTLLREGDTIDCSTTTDDMIELFQRHHGDERDPELECGADPDNYYTHSFSRYFGFHQATSILSFGGGTSDTPRSNATSLFPPRTSSPLRAETEDLYDYDDVDTNGKRSPVRTFPVFPSGSGDEGFVTPLTLTPLQRHDDVSSEPDVLGMTVLKGSTVRLLPSTATTTPQRHSGMEGAASMLGTGSTPLITPVRGLDNDLQSANYVSGIGGIQSPIPSCAPAALPIHRGAAPTTDSRRSTHASPSSQRLFSSARALAAHDVVARENMQVLHWGCFGLLVALGGSVYLWCSREESVKTLFMAEAFPMELVTAVASSATLSPHSKDAFTAFGMDSGRVVVHRYTRSEAPEVPLSSGTSDVDQRVPLTGCPDASAYLADKVILRMHQEAITSLQIVGHTLYMSGMDGVLHALDLCAHFLSTSATVARQPESRYANPSVHRQPPLPTTSAVQQTHSPFRPAHHSHMLHSSAQTLRPRVGGSRAGASLGSHPHFSPGRQAIGRGQKHHHQHNYRHELPMISPPPPQPTPPSARPHSSGPSSTGSLVDTVPSAPRCVGVRVGEPILHIEVTRNQEHIAVGTTTRLLVYHAGQLLNDVWSHPSVSLPSTEPLVVMKSADPVRGVRAFSWLQGGGGGPVEGLSARVTTLPAGVPRPPTSSLTSPPRSAVLSATLVYAGGAKTTELCVFSVGTRRVLLSRNLHRTIYAVASGQCSDEVILSMAPLPCAADVNGHGGSSDLSRDYYVLQDDQRSPSESSSGGRSISELSRISPDYDAPPPTLTLTHPGLPPRHQSASPSPSLQHSSPAPIHTDVAHPPAPAAEHLHTPSIDFDGFTAHLRNANGASTHSVSSLHLSPNTTSITSQSPYRHPRHSAMMREAAAQSSATLLSTPRSQLFSPPRGNTRTPGRPSATAVSFSTTAPAANTTDVIAGATSLNADRGGATTAALQVFELALGCADDESGEDNGRMRSPATLRLRGTCASNVGGSTVYVTLSPDGTVCATSGTERMVRIWFPFSHRQIAIDKGSAFLELDGIGVPEVLR